MTILVPADFSNASKVATYYAIGLAKKLEADIKVLHVVQVNSSGETLLKLRKLQEQLMEIAHEDGTAFLQEIQKKIRGKKPNISLHFKEGFDFVRTVNQFLKETDADLIVMGTTGASGLKKLLGSNTAALMNHATVPVLAVPDRAKFSALNKLVYATDLKHTEYEMQTVTMFAQRLGARVEVLHVAKDESVHLNAKDYVKALRELTKYNKIGFSLVKGKNIPQAVDSFVKKQKAKLLITFTHQLSFF